MKYSIAFFSKRLIKTNVFANFINLSSIQISNAVLQILFVPIVTRIVGITEFGYVVVFSSYAALAGTFINYGTNQTGIKEIAVSSNHRETLSKSFFTVLLIRGIIFLGFILVSLGLIILDIPHITYFLLAGTIVLAEVINPLFFYIGVERLFFYNILNILSKAITLILIVLFIKNETQAPWINFAVGSVNCVIYLILLTEAVRKYNLKYYRLPWHALTKYFKSNFYLLGNSLSVQLQQSFFLFMLAGAGNALVLGAYSIGDKIIWSTRLLLISISNVIFPRGAIIYSKSLKIWGEYKKQFTVITGSIFLIGSLILLGFPETIIKIMTGKENGLSVLYLRSMAFAPFFASLNVVNVFELLYEGNHRRIFIIAIILLVISVALTIALITTGISSTYGYYLTAMDLIALLLYLYYANKDKRLKTNINS